jgi:hypothetical protein
MLLASPKQLRLHLAGLYEMESLGAGHQLSGYVFDFMVSLSRILECSNRGCFRKQKIVKVTAGPLVGKFTYIINHLEETLGVMQKS